LGLASVREVDLSGAKLDQADLSKAVVRDNKKPAGAA
jgi:uncharacterized protein YjbI with pentapeptide repeats